MPMFSTATAVGFTLLAVAAGVPQPSLHRSLQSDRTGVVRDAQFEQTTTGNGRIDIAFGKSVQPSVIEVGASVAGHTTYQLELAPVGKADTVYTIYGHDSVPLVMPAAFQSPAPFGTHTGGSPFEFFQFAPDCQFDSYLFAAADANLGSIGIEFTAWTATAGIDSANGAVFFMNPDDAPPGPAVIAQLTVPTGSGFTAQCGAQGHNKLDPVYQATLDPANLSPGVDPSTVKQSWNEELINFVVEASRAAPVKSGH